MTLCCVLWCGAMLWCCVANVLCALGAVYVNLSEQRQITKRGLFYRQVDIANKQAVIDRGSAQSITQQRHLHSHPSVVRRSHGADGGLVFAVHSSVRLLLLPLSAIETLCTILQVQRGQLQVVSEITSHPLTCRAHLTLPLMPSPSLSRRWRVPKGWCAVS